MSWVGIMLGTLVWPPVKEIDGTYELMRVLVERETGFEPATFSLARRCSTPEPLPHYAVLAAPSQRMYYTVYPVLCQAKLSAHHMQELSGRRAEAVA
jgi:hypothetical protein